MILAGRSSRSVRDIVEVDRSEIRLGDQRRSWLGIWSFVVTSGAERRWHLEVVRNVERRNREDRL